MTESVRSMFPHVFDSSMIASARSCQQKVKRTYFEHWKPMYESVHLVAGGAFAKGLEEARLAFYQDGLPPAESVAKGLIALVNEYGDYEPIVDTAKTLDRMMGAFEFFMEAYPLGNDGFQPATFANGKLGIEFSFAYPIDVLHPVTNDPILYCGRADMVGTFADGFFGEDDKTTSSLGASWSKQWELRSQFTGYCWAMKKTGLNPQGILTRGVSILKTKYDTQECITYRSQWEIDRWYKQLCRDIENLKRAWAEDYFDYNLDTSCAEYGGCGFTQICKSKDPEVWLPQSFEKRVWDPLARQEVSVEEWEKQWGHQ